MLYDSLDWEVSSIEGFVPYYFRDNEMKVGGCNFCWIEDQSR